MEGSAVTQTSRCRRTGHWQARGDHPQREHGSGGPGRSWEETGCVRSDAEKRPKTKTNEALPGAVEPAQQPIHLHCLRRAWEAFSWVQGRDGERLVTPSGQVHSARVAGPRGNPHSTRGDPAGDRARDWGGALASSCGIPKWGRGVGDFLRSCASGEGPLCPWSLTPRLLFPPRVWRWRSRPWSPRGTGN